MFLLSIALMFVFGLLFSVVSEKIYPKRLYRLR